jgi:UDP-N-acetylmuramate-alanine ligase
MAPRVAPLLEDGDLVLTMGAGSIARLADALLKQLAEAAPDH